MANSKGRANRLRALAAAVLLAGIAAAFVVGAAFPASVTVSATLVKSTNYTMSAESGETAFNWLFALLILGPSIVAAAVLLSSSELAAALRRSGRSRSADDEAVAGETGAL